MVILADKAKDLKTVFRRYSLEAEPESPDSVIKAGLPSDPNFSKVAKGVIDGDAAVVESSLKAAFGAGIDPLTAINDGLIAGMNVVSDLYEKGLYYLPQVMIAADAMAVGIGVCEDKLGHPAEKKGLVVTHVAEGDIHDIGKEIVSALLAANGYEVINLGRDVPVEDVVNTVREKKPAMVTGTALMTTTMTAFPRIAARLKELGIVVPFVCGGGAVTKEFVEAYDYGIHGVKAHHAPHLAAAAVKGKSWKTIREDYEDITGGYAYKW